MSFTINHTTQRAGGGQIVRTKRLDARQIIVGRGADCDLQLSDLAVSLRHARLTQTGARLVSVEALSGQPFEIENDFVDHATIRLADNATLVFGAHVLTMAPGSAPDEVVVNVARARDATSSSTIDEEVRALAPGAAGWSKRAVAWMLGLVIAALCLAWPIGAFFAHQNQRLHADQQWSSGPLSRAHAFLNNDCQACHQKAFVAVGDKACLTCHRADSPLAARQAVTLRNREQGSPQAPSFVLDHAAHERLLQATPLPADLGGKLKALFERAFHHPENRCASCHREHLDPDGRGPVAGRKPTLIPDKPTLTLVQDCAACHGQLKARLPDTNLIDTPDWNRHPDFRPLANVSLDRQGTFTKAVMGRLAPGRPWTEPNGLIFSHRLHLAPGGGVARMGQVLGAQRGYGGALECSSCHRPDATAKGFMPVEMTRDCGACHSLAFARTGGTLRLLPHGHPDQVVAAIRNFYSAGASPAPFAATTDLGRRVPGDLSDSLLQDRSSGGSAAAALRAIFSPGGACHDCHTVSSPAGGDPLAWRVAPVRLSDHYLPRARFDHSVRQHRQAEDGHERCGDCHKAETSQRSEDLLLPSIATCAACHGKDKATTPAAAAADCGECHSYHAPSRPERVVAPVDRRKPSLRPEATRR